MQLSGILILRSAWQEPPSPKAGGEAHGGRMGKFFRQSIVVLKDAKHVRAP